MAHFIFRLCRNRNAMEMVPKERIRLDLLKLAKEFKRVDFKTKQLLSIEIDNVKASIYPDGRVLLFDTDEGKANGLAPEIFKAIKKHSLKNGKLQGTALFVGRFQPFHMGHFKVVKDIVRGYGRIVIVIAGPDHSPTLKDPFTFREREEMITKSLRRAGIRDFEIRAIRDVKDDAEWEREILRLGNFDVAFTRNAWTGRCLKKAGIEVRKQKNYERYRHCGTKIRERIIHGKKWDDLVPDEVFDYIREIKGEERIRRLSKK